MTKEFMDYKTLGDMPKEMQDAMWENDPSLLPTGPKTQELVDTGVFQFFQAQGYLPEDAFPNDPTERAKYRAFLKGQP